jgi:DNA-binding transcriptional LysR family regulator
VRAPFQVLVVPFRRTPTGDHQVAMFLRRDALCRQAIAGGGEDDEAARRDLGITVMPRSLCRADIDRRTLRRVLPAWTAGEVTTTLLVPERRADLPAVRVIADALVAHVAAHQPDAPARSRRSRRGKR